MDAKEIECFPGFYYVPGKEKYGIAKNGDLIIAETGRRLKWSIFKPVESKGITGGYYINRAGKRHRLLALTFIDKPERHRDKDFSELMVNHLNGIPGDDDLDNLEWVTASENIKHAYRSGLHSRTLAVLLMDFRTGDEHSFVSVQAMCEYSGMHHATATGRLRRRPGVRYGDFAIKYDDGLPWPKGYMDEFGSGTPVMAKCMLTGKIYIAESASKLSDILGVSQSIISRVLARGGVSVSSGYAIASYDDDDVTWPVLTDDQIEIIRMSGRSGRPGIKITDTVTDTSTLHVSINDAAQNLDTTRNVINNNIRRKKLVHNRYKVELISVN